MRYIPVRIDRRKILAMLSNKSFFNNESVATQTEPALDNDESDQNYSAISYGSETEEDIDLCDMKPAVTEFFVKIETEISEPVVCKTEPDLSPYDDALNRRPRVVLQRIENPLRVPKTEPVSDEELTQMDDFSQSETGFMEDDFSNKTDLSVGESETVLSEETSLRSSDSETLNEFFLRKGKKAKRKCLSIAQMYDVIQNDSGFFSRKKVWMSKEVLRQLPKGDKIFLSNLFKKFMKRKKLRKKK